MAAQTESKKTWRSRFGEICPWIVFGLIMAALHFHDWFAVSRQPEAWELKERLTKSDDLKDYFAFVASVEPDWRIPSKSGGRRPKLWKVSRHETLSEGYFTFHVSGWRRLSDDRRGNDWLTVYFVKRPAEPIAVTKIVRYSSLMYE